MQHAWNLDRPQPLLIGEADGIAALTVLAREVTRTGAGGWQPLALFGSDTGFPFKPRPSTILVPGLPPGVIACSPELDAWGIPSRLASRADLPGCFEGDVSELAAVYLRGLDRTAHARLQLITRCPAHLFTALEQLAREWGIPLRTA